MLRKMEEKKMLIGELTQGMELVAQLNQLDLVESREACQALVEKIVSTYEKALYLLKGLKRDEHDQVETFHQTPAGHSNQVVTKYQNFPNNAFKKRKTVTRWNEEMSVYSAADGGDDSPKDDGHRWRKYGQKLILGAKFPRAYYRCTHSKSKGCLATKKVQRSDYDSSTFQISYKGIHTCIQSSTSSSPSDIPLISNSISKFNPSDALRNLQQGLKIETANEFMSFKEEDSPFTQIQSAENVDNELFWNLLVKDVPDLDDPYYLPVFVSPTTSGSDFIAFDWQLNDYGLSSGSGSGGGGGVLRSSESEHATDMNLTPTSGFESPFDYLNFDPYRIS